MVPGFIMLTLLKFDWDEDFIRTEMNVRVSHIQRYWREGDTTRIQLEGGEIMLFEESEEEVNTLIRYQHSEYGK